MGKHPSALWNENHAHPRHFVRQWRYRFFVPQNRAGVNRRQAENSFQRRGLPRPVRSHKRHDLALINGNINTVQSFHASVMNMNIFKLKQNFFWHWLLLVFHKLAVFDGFNYYEFNNIAVLVKTSKTTDTWVIFYFIQIIFDTF